MIKMTDCRFAGSGDGVVDLRVRKGHLVVWDAEKQAKLQFGR